MSLFTSTNICCSSPQMISLREESPEIHSQTKVTTQNSSFKSKHTANSLSTKKSQMPELKLSYEIEKEKSFPVPPMTEEKQSDNDVSNNFSKFIMETFKNDDELTLREKLTFSLFLVMNQNCFTEELISEFNEEECQLSLLNWIWRYKKKMKQFQLQHQLKNYNLIENFEILLPQYNKLLIEINFIMELLINILNFFVFLPINSSDILNLKLYEKLIKIKEYIKPFANEYLLNLTNFVLNKWKTEVEQENETKIIATYKLSRLGVKHARPVDDKEDKEDTEADSVEDNDINIKETINNNPNNYSNLNKKTKNNIKVSFDLQKNSTIYFKHDDIPFQISLDKQKMIINS